MPPITAISQRYHKSPSLPSHYRPSPLSTRTESITHREWCLSVTHVRPTDKMSVILVVYFHHHIHQNLFQSLKTFTCMRHNKYMDCFVHRPPRLSQIISVRYLVKDLSDFDETCWEYLFSKHHSVFDVLQHSRSDWLVAFVRYLFDGFRTSHTRLSSWKPP